MAMTTADMDHRFDLQPPRTPEAGQLMDAVRAGIKDLAVALDDALPNCREKSLAITKLEEATFWAIGSIARNQPPGDD